MTTTSFSAVILAGGTGARLGGFDKAGIEHHGRTLLQAALDAVLDAAEVVVVGAPVPTDRPVTFVREDPPHGGPAAGLLTGLQAFLTPPSTVAVTAVDMPYLTPRTLRRLRRAAEGYDGAVLVDPDGRRQLAFVVSADALAACAPEYELWHGLPLRTLLAPLSFAEVPAAGDEALDIDTWEDLRDH